MKAKNFFISTLKEVPQEAQLISHKLMLRAGLIKKIASGIYTWMPLGLRIIRKIEKITREEMNQAGAAELLLPVIQPAELWKQSNRWDLYGKALLKIKDRNNRDFCFGPTHEEVIAYVFNNTVSSYKQLPINLYQIQIKFRDEIRPRFGVMRAREFIMKDAYSFHMDVESLNKTYQVMYNAYSKILDRLGLIYRAVEADSGDIGGSKSHEFQVLSNNGEDTIVYSDTSNYAANIERAPTLPLRGKRKEPTKPLLKTHTPNVKTIKDLVNFTKVSIEKTIKAIIVEGTNDDLVLLLLRGDHSLNEVKAQNLPLVKSPLIMASEDDIENKFSARPGSLGPCGFNGKIYADYAIEKDNDFIVGANETDYHFTGFNFDRDAKEVEFVDLRNIEEGDLSPDGEGIVKFAKGIEVGHVFQIGSKKYSEPLNISLLNKEGKNQYVEMGCYGLGVSRLVAASIEQNYDDNGIIWDQSISPFEVIIIPINYYKDQKIKEITDNLYKELMDLNIDVLLDDRDERAGVLLKDADLIGYTHQIIIGEKQLQNNKVEYNYRKNNNKKLIEVENIVNFITKELVKNAK